MLTTSISGSLTRVTPPGNGTSAARIWVPSSTPSIDTVRLSGMDSASASISIAVASWVTSVPEAASPSSTTLTSTVTFSPRLTTIRSAWVMERLIGCTVTALGSASCSLPPICRLSTALRPDFRSTAAKSRALSSRCCGSVPWP